MLAIVLFLVIPGCARSASIQKASITYKAYKQGVLLPSYPIFYVRGNVVEVQSDPFVNFLGDDPQWSADGNWVTFSTETYTSLSRQNSSSIYLMNTDGSKKFMVVTKGENHHPTWNPAGTQIAYDKGNQIWILDVSCFIDGYVNCQSEPAYLVDGSHPDWSPNGEEIAFETNEHHIAVISLHDPRNKINDLTPQIQAFTPDWSPDGKSIVFSAYDNAKDSLDIVVIDYITGKVDNLTNGIGSNTRPKWTPDGKKIVFISSHRDGLGNIIGIDDTIRSSAIFIMNPESLEMKRVGSTEDEMVIWYSVLP